MQRNCNWKYNLEYESRKENLTRIFNVCFRNNSVHFLKKSLKNANILWSLLNISEILSLHYLTSNLANYKTLWNIPNSKIMSLQNDFQKFGYSCIANNNLGLWSRKERRNILKIWTLNCAVRSRRNYSHFFFRIKIKSDKSLIRVYLSEFSDKKFRTLLEKSMERFFFKFENTYS